MKLLFDNWLMEHLHISKTRIAFYERNGILGRTMIGLVGDYHGYFLSNHSQEFKRDEHGRIIEVHHTHNLTDLGLKNSWTLKYDKDGNLIKRVDDTGNGQFYENNRLVRAMVHGHELVYTYEETPAGLVRTTHRTTGDTTTISVTITRGDQLIYTERPDGYSIAHTYDPDCRKRTSSVSSNGTTHIWQYDTEGNLTREYEPDGTLSTFVYDHHGNCIMETVDEEVWNYGYDQHNNRILSISPTLDELGNQIVHYMSYDKVGNMTKSTTGGNTSTWSFDWNNDVFYINKNGQPLVVAQFEPE